MIQKYIPIVLVSITILVFIWFLFTYWIKFTTPYNHQVMGEIYSNSQYIKGSETKGGIGDDGLYAVAGYYLFFDNGDPTQVNFENPPLGQYLIGLSIYIFKNERAINLIYALFYIVLIYLLGKELFSRNIALFAILVLSLDPLFHEHLIASLLDLPQSLFILGAFYFFLKALKNPSYFWVSSFFWGCAFSTKFFPGIIFLLGICAIWCYHMQKKYIIHFLISLCLIPAVYLASYTVYFTNHTFMDFINFHKWMIVWRAGNPRVFGNIIVNLLTGYYRNWWEPVAWLKTQTWTIFRPILTIGSVASILFLKGIHKERRMHVIYFYWSIIIFLLYISIGTTGVDKYIFPIYPFILLFGSYSLVVLYSSLKQKMSLFAILAK